VKDVLICCTDAEGSQLEWLAKALFDTGWSVNFMHKGSSGVASAHCVIAVWSPKSVGDPWLMARAKTAAKRRRLVSIRLGGARPPRGLRSEQVIDLSEWPARGADRAMNSLLGSVDAVANGVSQKAGTNEDSRAWVAIGAAVLLIGGGFALYQVASQPSSSRSEQNYSDESARAADQAAAAAHAMQKAAAERASNASETGATSGDGEPAAKPKAEMPDAARVGAQALSQLTAVIETGSGELDVVRRSAEEALTLNAQQPQARATLAVLTGLGDLKWSEAAAYADSLNANSSDAALANVARRYRRMAGLSRDSIPSDPLASPLCAINDDAAFVQAIVDLNGAQRLALLKFGCVVERIGNSSDVRTRLGMG